MSKLLVCLTIRKQRIMNNIADIRRQRNLTSSEVAIELGITQGHYSHLENGRREFPNKLIPRLAKILQVSEGELLECILDLKPFYKINNNWIWKIKINDLGVVDAFKEELDFIKRRGSNDPEEMLERFIKFIEYNIGKSIKEELSKDGLLKEQVLSKIG